MFLFLMLELTKGAMQLASAVAAIRSAAVKSGLGILLLQDKTDHVPRSKLKFDLPRVGYMFISEFKKAILSRTYVPN
jgi:hypothetical protein